MRISHFFIDRPIFAAVVSIVFVILGGVSFSRLPVAQYPEIAPPIINVSGQYPGASAEVVAARAADQRRREHALHVVEFDGRRQILDPGEFRSRH
jgi:multidrug efflux pump subunit AcrB